MPIPRSGHRLVLLVLLLLSTGPLLCQSFEDFAARATAAREAGKPADAVRDYQAALKLKPDWEEGWFYLGPSTTTATALQMRLGPSSTS